MLIRPDLSNMSHSEKDSLIHKLFNKIDELMAKVDKVDTLEARVKDLAGHVAKKQQELFVSAILGLGRA